jgi:succinate dehydrogenase/fumarate reductase flavoprotein subunit
MRDESLNVSGILIRVQRWDTVIVGAGAAGMNAAVHLAEFRRGQGDTRPGGRIAVIAGALRGGASRMSGSDKQTYYKLGTAVETPDSACSMAESLTAFGCCHEDLALIEAANSLREFHHLVECGVPFPHDPLGAFVGYKTDHDPFERATSAGPRTSRMMSEALEAEARRLGVTMIDHQEAVRLVIRENQILALLTWDKSESGWTR